LIKYRVSVEEECPYFRFVKFQKIKQQNRFWLTQITNSKEHNHYQKLIFDKLVKRLFRRLKNPNVHYRVHNSPLPDPILSHLHPLHTLPSCLSKSILILFCLRLGILVDLIPSVFSIKVFTHFSLSHSIYMHHPPHPPWFDHPNVWLRV
jgi:hypothetical protein